METTITPKALAEASGCSLRSAYHYIGGTLPWPPEVAAAYERLTGVSRLYLLYPGEYDRTGQRMGASDVA